MEDLVAIIDTLKDVGLLPIIVLTIVVIVGVKWIRGLLKVEKDEVRVEFKKEIELLKERQENTDKAQDSTIKRLEEADKQANERFKEVNDKIEQIDSKHNSQYQNLQQTLNDIKTTNGERFSTIETKLDILLNKN